MSTRRWIFVALVHGLVLMTSPAVGQTDGTTIDEVVRELNAHLENSTVSFSEEGTIIVLVRAPEPWGSGRWPVPGAGVSVQALGCACPGRERTTDGNGRVRFDELPTGLYRLDVRFPGFDRWSGRILLMGAAAQRPTVTRPVTLRESGSWPD